MPGCEGEIRAARASLRFRAKARSSLPTLHEVHSPSSTRERERADARAFVFHFGYFAARDRRGESSACRGQGRSQRGQGERQGSRFAREEEVQEEGYRREREAGRQR